jgi:hypothetical protein
MKALPLANLHKRHAGVTPSQATVFVEAATVCLDGLHAARTQAFSVSASGSPQGFAWPHPEQLSVNWDAIDEAVAAAYANVEDTVETGAYGVAFAAADAHLGLEAIGRAAIRTGADYYVRPRRRRAPIPSNFYAEDAFRLEVSGTRGDRGDCHSRLRQTVAQVRRGGGDPGLAVVIGFATLQVDFEGVG